MHMADALLSPAVGGAFAAVSGGVLAWSARRVGREADERRVPLMGVLGAFVFAAQMINFSIPGTGSSGHLGGGMLLAILLGPHAAFLVMASVLVIQSLFFLDGGILALGANSFNLGVWPCFLGLLVYRAIAGRRAEGRRRLAASVGAVVASLELGAFGVVMQTLLSGRSELPFGKFALLMAGIHLPISLVEGVVTAGVVEFVKSLRPGIVAASEERAAMPERRETLAPVVASFAALAILLGCVAVWFASPKPDGLEWALAKTGVASDAQASPSPALEALQKKTALMPGYNFRAAESGAARAGGVRPHRSAGTSAAGFIGALITCALVSAIAAALYLLRPRRRSPQALTERR